MTRGLRWIRIVAAVALPALGACADMQDDEFWSWGKKKELPESSARSEPVRTTTDDSLAGSGSAAGARPAFVSQTGTIGTVMYLQSSRKMRLEGCGLVIGLNGRGSSRCPRAAEEYLQREIRRSQLSSPGAVPDFSPQELIESPHTAAVMIDAEVPAAAVAGTRFDVYVRAVDPAVESLIGGVLLATDLRLPHPQRRLEGRIMGRASGRVFANPFARDDDTSDALPGRGRILGGGTNDDDRVIQIVSVTPSYAVVQQVMRIVNERFGGMPKTADAVSTTNVRLHVPGEYRSDPAHFVQLVFHLPLMDSLSMAELRIKALGDELARPDAPYEETALCLEAVGATAIPTARKYYAHRQRATSFYAARVGARLGDDLAIEVLAHHANDSGSPFRHAAIRELGDAAARHGWGGAMRVLRTLLADPDPTIRLPAYEGLQKAGASDVTRYVVGTDNYVLDVVSCGGPSLIYARRTAERRFAILGPPLYCQPPVFYSYPDRPVTVSANVDAEKVVLVRRDDGRVWKPLRVSLRVEEMVRALGGDRLASLGGDLQGLGVDYAHVMDVLSVLCRSGSIPSRFYVEQPDLQELLGPTEPLERPESDEL
jgi:hypothetical protein